MKRRWKFLTLLLAGLLFLLSAEGSPIQAKKKKDSVSMVFTGDFLFAKDYAPYYTFVKRGKDITKCIEKPVVKIMKKADFLVMNNEFTYTNRGTPTPNKPFTFRAFPEMAKELNKLGVDLVSLANNHSYDYGEVSLLDTMETLKGVKVPYVGAGKNIEEAETPHYFEKNGIKIAVVAATSIEKYTVFTKPATKDKPGVARCLDTKRLEKVIKKAKKKADIVIAFVHWGTEGQNQADRYQLSQAKNLAKTGVDLIVGSHAHVLQLVDYVEGVPVVYGLGNFWFNSRDNDTGMLRIEVKKDGIKKIRFIPCKQKNMTTSLLDGKEKKRVLDFMRKLSPNVTFDEEGVFTKRAKKR